MRVLVIIYCVIGLYAGILAQDPSIKGGWPKEIKISNTYLRGSAEGVLKYYRKGEEVPYSGILYANFASGEVRYIFETVGGLPDGQWIRYYDNGKYRELGHFVSGKTEGKVVYFYPAGQIRHMGSYRLWRIRKGIWQFYDQDGNLSREVDYGLKGSSDELDSLYKVGLIGEKRYLNTMDRFQDL